MNQAPDPLRLELAAAAARLIADGGLDYASAKKKALRQAFGARAAPKGSIPDNDEIDAALLEHLALFDPGHAARIAQRRQLAATLMQRLQAFQPFVTGAVWKGIVTEHAPIHLQLFHDDAKEIEIELLNAGLAFDVATVPHFRGTGEVEAIVFHLNDVPVLLSLYAHDDLRGALRAGPAGAERGDRRALLARAAEPA